MQGFLIIDKPTTWTSHDVVAKLRGILKEKKIGHLGTLDPLATGVLVVAVGRSATKQIQHFMKLDKEYEVELELGKISDTYDSDGKVEKTGFDVRELDKKLVQETLESFWGKSMQMPPAFSAKKIHGKKAYELARAGKPVELKEVEVEMQGRDIEVNLPFVRFIVTVSSGTYVRSLVHDFGQKLGCGALLTALRRIRVGDFKIADAQTLEQIQRESENPLSMPSSICSFLHHGSEERGSGSSFFFLYSLMVQKATNRIMEDFPGEAQRKALGRSFLNHVGRKAPLPAEPMQESLQYSV
ncbi:MAG: tRNA pseudouridine(55) synthase TruB [Candidatus Gracilibacteria bacterium]